MRRMTGAKIEEVSEYIKKIHFEITRAKGSRKNNFTFLTLRFRLGLVDFREQKEQ